MNRRRLVAIAVGAAALVGAGLVLRSGVQPPLPAAVGPDGQRIAAYHDAALVTPPARPGSRPQQPGRLHTDTRRLGALVSWAAAPYGFEVRWGKAGARGTETRYVAAPSVGLTGLDADRYRVEVRSVDEMGQRSEPSVAEFDVKDEAPQWQRGLGFVDDFTQGADLAPDRWRRYDEDPPCVRRDGERGPLLVTGRCRGPLRPVSRLGLSDPGADGVRGRFVLLADTPPRAVRPPEQRAEQVDDETYGAGNELDVLIGAPAFFPEGGLMLRIGWRGAWLLADAAALIGGPLPAHGVTRLDVPPGGPGALRRWELVFVADEVRVLLDGQRVGSVPYRPAWRTAEVSITAMVIDDRGPGVRIGLVGLTGDPPPGRPTEVRQLEPPGVDQPHPEQRIALPAVPTAAEARLSGVLSSDDPSVFSPRSPGESLRPPDVVAEVGGRRVDVTAPRGAGGDFGVGWFELGVPADLARPGTEVVLRSTDGRAFAAFALELRLDHQPGTPVRRAAIGAPDPVQPALPKPELVVKSGERRYFTDDTLPRARLDVEVRLDAVQAQAATGSVAGWVALRVELDGRRILDVPTAVDGPAVAGVYRFTLDAGELPRGRPLLVVSLVPARPGVRPVSTDFTLRVDA